MLYCAFLISFSLLSQAEWKIFMYMEPGVGLHDAAWRNINDLLRSSHAPETEIYIQLHAYDTIAWRYRIKQNALIQDSAVTLHFDYIKDTLDGAKWAFKTTPPAEKNIFILWGHGFGILSPQWNEKTKDWQVEYDEAMDICTTCRHVSGNSEYCHANEKALLINNTNQTYITHYELTHILKEICNTFLHKKIDIFGMDMCLGASIEHAFHVAPYVNYLVASQNCELPDGFEYCGLRKHLQTKRTTTQNLLNNIIDDYTRYYEKRGIKGEYTLSAIDCRRISKCIKSFDNVIDCLKDCFIYCPNFKNTLKEALKYKCPHFCYVPMYTDLYTVIDQIEKHLCLFGCESSQLLSNLHTLIQKTKKEIKKTIVANTTGFAMKNAHGMSIYFPLSHIDSSYFSVPFAQQTQWLDFLKLMVQ